jgi:hypothetical protein
LSAKIKTKLVSIEREIKRKGGREEGRKRGREEGRTNFQLEILSRMLTSLGLCSLFQKWSLSKIILPFFFST